MSKRAIIIAGAVALVLVAVVVILALPRSQAPDMTGGPGMIYFYSKT
jgi:hypothetical protein